MPHPNELLVRRWFEEVWNQRRLATIDALSAPDAVGHSEQGDLVGAAAWRTMFSQFVAAMPDLRVTVDDVLASDDRAAVRWTFVGTHTAPLLDVAPRNRSVRVTGTTWFRIAGGRLVEAWDTWNQGRLLQSLGGVG